METDHDAFKMFRNQHAVIKNANVPAEEKNASLDKLRVICQLFEASRGDDGKALRDFVCDLWNALKAHYDKKEVRLVNRAEYDILKMLYRENKQAALAAALEREIDELDEKIETTVTREKEEKEAKAEKRAATTPTTGPSKKPKK